MSSPIPRRLLPHTAILEPFDKIEGSVPTYLAAVTLTFVRCEPVRHNAMTNLGEARNDKLTLFYDPKTSRPAGLVPTKKSKVTIDGVAYQVREVVPCYGSGPSVHHYEVALA